ncbi:hypothetical protein [Halomicrobium salinisoli]|uniref:hypothetical protein n=1 Tax=Halomicrobium salinisoli TaxID=2878391 RepID=UPI001CF0AF4C|nr:hypothetical protein [Halomicrobium salinisoli]
MTKKNHVTIDGTAVFDTLEAPRSEEAIEIDWTVHIDNGWITDGPNLNGEYAYDHAEGDLT